MLKIYLAVLLFAVSFAAVANPTPNPVATTANDLTLQLHNAKLHITFTDNIPEPQKKAFLDWIMQSATTVASYYGAFPVQQAGINIIGTNDNGVRTGRAMQGTEHPQILVWVGANTSENVLDEDWVMIHEMIHLATATLPRRHRWFEEGLSVYVESIARAQEGRIEASKVWSEFAKRMPNGQLQNQDKGLDVTSRWGRTYWGGATFFLLADIHIRETSDNQFSLRDALKRAVSQGLTMNKNASIQTVIEAMDQALPAPVIAPLHKRYARQSTSFPLDDMWRDLGVDTKVPGKFDDHARFTCIRKAITNPGDLQC